MMKNMMAVSLLALLFGGCNLDGLPCAICGRDGGDAGGSEALVNIQVTETSNPDAFERVISELEAREIKTTILVDADFTDQNCETLRALDSNGFEIMAFARPEAPEDEVVTLSMLSYEEQEDIIAGVKAAIEDCLGKSIAGFRCYRFDQNEDTYAIMDSLGFEFNLGFVAHSENCFPGYGEATLPYAAPGYDFWAVPMHSAYFEDEWATFCDMPFSRRVEGEEWGSLMISELNNMRRQNRPLIVEIHPYFSGVEDDWFEAFVSFLDYAKGLDARFMTIEELVEWSQDEENRDVCAPCEED